MSMVIWGRGQGLFFFYLSCVHWLMPGKSGKQEIISKRIKTEVFLTHAEFIRIKVVSDD